MRIGEQVEPVTGQGLAKGLGPDYRREKRVVDAVGDDGISFAAGEEELPF